MNDCNEKMERDERMLYAVKERIRADMEAEAILEAVRTLLIRGMKMCEDDSEFGWRVKLFDAPLAEVEKSMKVLAPNAIIGMVEDDIIDRFARAHWTGTHDDGDGMTPKEGEQ